MRNNQNNNRLEKIICPRCGREYLPGEIYIPKAFLGQPTEVFRMSDGKIDDYFGTTMDTTERYTCDECNTIFEVKANVRFTTTIIPDVYFDEDYCTSLLKPNLIVK